MSARKWFVGFGLNVHNTELWCADLFERTEGGYRHHVAYTGNADRAVALAQARQLVRTCIGGKDEVEWEEEAAPVPTPPMLNNPTRDRRMAPALRAARHIARARGQSMPLGRLQYRLGSLIRVDIVALVRSRPDWFVLAGNVVSLTPAGLAAGREDG